STASSQARIPLARSFILVCSRIRLKKSQVIADDWMLLSPERSMSLYIARFLRLFARLERSWQPLQSRLSSGRSRNSVSWLRPPLRSTVTASAVQPAFSARVAVAAATSHLLVAYICIQIGAPRALMTSSTASEVWLERICRWSPALAARATPDSASSWNERWPPTGAQTIGDEYLVP